MQKNAELNFMLQETFTAEHLIYYKLDLYTWTLVNDDGKKTEKLHCHAKNKSFNIIGLSLMPLNTP